MTEATPRPWKMEDTERGIHNVDEFMFHVVGPDFETNYEHLVLDNENYYPHDVSRANAALIVRAVNAHDGLIAALEAVEWTPFGVYFVCPSCKEIRSSPDSTHDAGHTDKCQLAAALAKGRNA